MIALIEKIQLMKKIKSITFINVITVLLIFTFLLSILNSFSLMHKSEKQKIVIFDRELLFKDYYQSMKKIADQSKSQTVSQQFLDRKNAIFIKAMLSDLNNYQNEHNAIVIKRSSLTAPAVFNGTNIDITKTIEKELKKQGAIG